MKTGAAFIVMLALAAAAAAMVLRLAPARRTEAVPAATPAASSLILAGHPTTLAFAHALVARTSMQVAAAWPVGTPWAEQAEAARQQTAEWQAMARRADAVVTLRQAARGDALFAAVRVLNPRVIEIDASVNADQQTPSVRLRTDGAAGPSFALSPTNAIRLTERLAADLTALHPNDATMIAENLRAVKARLLRLKAKFDKEFALVAAPEVVAFSGEFDYLCEDFGVQMVERIDKDFARWSRAERTANLEKLQRAGVRVGLHAYPPGADLAAFLSQAKVKPVVLDPLTHSVVDPEAYFQKLESNLTALKAALVP